MRTMVITRQSICQGTEALVIYRSARAYYVAHVDAQGHATPLSHAQCWTYTSAQERLQQEMRARSHSRSG
jgi:hypothetical protein